MPKTPKYDLPYPPPSGAADVPYDVQQLAEAVERLVDGLVYTRGGQHSTTSDTNGRTTITHGLGSIPLWVQLTPIFTVNIPTSRVQKPTVLSVSATTITVQWYRDDSNIEFAGNPVSCFWTVGKV